MGKPRDVNTRQGRQLQSCELRLTDPSCASFGLQLWDTELIRLAQQWTPWETGNAASLLTVLPFHLSCFYFLCSFSSYVFVLSCLVSFSSFILLFLFLAFLFHFPLP